MDVKRTVHRHTYALTNIDEAGQDLWAILIWDGTFNGWAIHAVGTFHSVMTYLMRAKL